MLRGIDSIIFRSFPGIFAIAMALFSCLKFSIFTK